MNNFILIIFAIAWLNCIDAQPNISEELEFTESSDDRFIDVINSLLEISNDESIPLNAKTSTHMTLDVEVKESKIVVRSTKKGPTRNYNTPITPQQKADLTYIVHTLARSSLTSIAGEKSSLKKAGDRIDNLHPLRFLTIIFTDESLKADISALRSRGWAWGKFFDGLEGSLIEESRKKNITPEFISDFASIIGIDSNLIIGSIQGQHWKDFVNILIDTVPRSGNPGRYDM